VIIVVLVVILKVCFEYTYVTARRMLMLTVSASWYRFETEGSEWSAAVQPQCWRYWSMAWWNWGPADVGRLWKGK